MSEFALAKSQRVLIPVYVAGAENVWGIIAGYHAKLGREPLYDVQWQSAHTVDEHFNFVTSRASIAESELILAQPPAMVTEEEATRRCKACFDDGHLSAMETVRREREARTRKRKKPAKAKSKSKRKH